MLINNTDVLIEIEDDAPAIAVSEGDSEDVARLSLAVGLLGKQLENLTDAHTEICHFLEDCHDKQRKLATTLDVITVAVFGLAVLAIFRETGVF